MYLTVESLIEIDSLIADLNNITLRKVNVKPFGYDTMFMDKDLIEDKLYEIIDQFNKNKITRTKFYSRLLNEIHPSYDGTVRTCKILFPNYDKINILMRQKIRKLII